MRPFRLAVVFVASVVKTDGVVNGGDTSETRKIDADAQSHRGLWRSTE